MATRDEFSDLTELEAKLMSLPDAEMRALHLGKELEQTDSPQEREEDLKNVSDETRQYAKGIKREPETDAVAVVNKGSEKLATTGTVQYDIVNHEEAFMPVVEALRDLGVSVSGYIRHSDGKNRVMVQAFTDREFDLGETGDNFNETHQIGFQVKNTYNKSGSVVMRAFFMRQVCSNGMQIPVSMKEPLKRQHRGEVDVLEDYKEWIDDLVNSSENFRNFLLDATTDLFDEEYAIRIMVNAGLPKTKITDILEKIEPHSDQPFEIPEGKVSRKQLYDAVTNYITHELEDVAFTTEERYHKWANRILTADGQELIGELDEGEAPIPDDQQRFSAIPLDDESMEVEE